MTPIQTVTADEFEGLLETRLSPEARQRWQAAGLEYHELSPEERDRYLLDVLEVLVSGQPPAAGEHRLPAWEAGWGENLQALRAGGATEALVPRYHSKRNLVRWRQRIVRPVSSGFDYRIHCLLVDWAVETFLGRVDALYEFGCGPAYHLLRARQFNRHARLVGLDWTAASQQIIAEAVARGLDNNLEGRSFDFLRPDTSLNLAANSGVLTVAALEQIGERFEPFLQFLLERKPAVCVHLEPIDELLDPNHLLDRLSVLYCRKRGYLAGFLPRLEALQKEGRITIHRAQRTYSGSYFIDGHSLIVWSPNA